MERCPKLSKAVDFGINSTYLHAHIMHKIKVPLSKFVKVLKKFSKSSQKVLAQKFSIVTRAVVS
jgi:hypothetical protein